MIIIHSYYEKRRTINKKKGENLQTWRASSPGENEKR